MISCSAQDCVVLLAPYPNNLSPNTVESCNVKTDFQVVLQGDSPVRVLLHLHLVSHRSQGARARFSASHQEVSLAYCSTLEPTSCSRLKCSALWLGQQPAPYICLFANVLGHAPLVPCFLGGSNKR